MMNLKLYLRTVFKEGNLVDRNSRLLIPSKPHNGSVLSCHWFPLIFALELGIFNWQRQTNVWCFQKNLTVSLQFLPLLLQGAHGAPWLLRYTTQLSNVVTFLREIWIPEPLHLPFFSELHLLTASQNHMGLATFLRFRHSIVLNGMQEKEKREGNFSHIDTSPHNSAQRNIPCRCTNVIKLSSPKTYGGESVSDFKDISVIVLGSQDVHDDGLFKSLEKKLKC